MTTRLVGLILTGLLLACCGCATKNVTTATPDDELGPSASATQTDTALETYYWSGEANPDPNAQ